tara:strand:- start:263 stop:1012 length:750 start_codon:yes stop_codon:yes gene_type:complete
MNEGDAVATIRRLAPNFRPLGQGAIRPGRLYRSGTMTAFDQAAWAAVRALGIRTLIDLRGTDEVDSMPVQPPAGVKLVSVPMPAENSWDAEADHSTDQLAKAQMEQSYRQIVASQGGAIADVFRILAQEAAVPAVIFCTAGKDRTGIVSALLLRAIGAADQDLYSDYGGTNLALTGEARRRTLGFARRASPFPLPSGAAGDAILSADQTYLDAALKEAGPVGAYLARHGIDPADIARLRKVFSASEAAA